VDYEELQSTPEVILVQAPSMRKMNSVTMGVS
jgi:hypothetical protein